MRMAWHFVVIAIAIVAFVSIFVACGIILSQEERHFLPMRDTVVAFINNSHADAAPFLMDVDLIYQGGGVFSGDGWYIKIYCGGQDCPACKDCTAYADFAMARTQNSSGIPHRIIWQGTISNGAVTEISYTHAV